MGGAYPDQTLAEINFQFEYSPDSLSASFSYALLDSYRRNEGIVSDAFAFLLDTLPELIKPYDLVLTRLYTLVSDKNLPSLRIMESRFTECAQQSYELR
jgi:RimJ/RimL family protein N-acetyltransferase